ncbi:MAG: hypothetical protein PHQ40_10035 [Anaerolineaceae bacterium]|nr:hypothetical protein [Anaerolineaceae bacterium]
MNPKTKILIVAVTDVEARALIEVFRETTSIDPKPISVGDRVYHDLGVVSDARVYLALSEMGAGGLGAAQQTVQKGISALSPTAVIMVGIAFGVNHEKQNIGDIMVSQQISLYELQRVSKTEIIPRGDKPHASSRLIDYFRGASLYWKIAKVQFGLILSGEKLIDSVDYREQLSGIEPDAIGGEMEGAGLYVACQDAHVDWILVKAICDWADGNKGGPEKEANQTIAAKNAAKFVLFALNQSSLKGEPSLFIEKETIAPVTDKQLKATYSSIPNQPYFFGREKELQSIAEAISPEARTWGALIDGPGGIGKTALAIRAGHLAPIDHFPLKIFLSAKIRELTPVGEKPLQDFMLPNYITLLSELARELGEESLVQLDPNDRANAVRRVLSNKSALIIIDNVETFSENECVRLYQFLTRLPPRCKAIVTSRRRTDIDARIIRLDRLGLRDVLDLLAELSSNYRSLKKATQKELRDLYEITYGNPLLIKWVVGQLGRSDSHYHSVPEVCKFIRAAPQGNDPLEFIFGDLLDTFTENETAVLAALTHFSGPAKIEWISLIANVPVSAASFALEDLSDRALLYGNEKMETYFLPPLTATYLRNKRPEAIIKTGDRIVERALALVLENGYDNYERFHILEAEWPTIESALPLIIRGENSRLQTFCGALDKFMLNSARWDEWAILSQKAEAKALAENDFLDAAQRAIPEGMIAFYREQPSSVHNCADRCEAYYQKCNSYEPLDKSRILRLHSMAFILEDKNQEALVANEEALKYSMSVTPVSEELIACLINRVETNRRMGVGISPDINYQEVLRLARNLNCHEAVTKCIALQAENALEKRDWFSTASLAGEALKLAEYESNLLMTGICCIQLAEAFIKQDKPHEALPYAQRGVEILSRIGCFELDNEKALLQECEVKVSRQSSTIES